MQTDMKLQVQNPESYVMQTDMKLQVQNPESYVMQNGNGIRRESRQT